MDTEPIKAALEIIFWGGVPRPEVAGLSSRVPSGTRTAQLALCGLRGK
jgi:hypothetical protein